MTTTSMDRISSISTIDRKMAEMKIKNLELLKRHQEIEEDRQRAQQSGATTIITTVESTKGTTMRGTTKNRGRNATTQQNFQENQVYRPPVRRKFENVCNDIQPQRAQRVDYNRLKHERTQETVNQQYNNNIISPELLEYAYPFHYQSEDNHDADEAAHAKKLVIVNNQATRIGSGRFNQQQQRTQEQSQHRRREERMRRSGTNNNGHPGGPSEFHLDVPQIPMWHNGSLQPPIHVQLLPTNITGHHTGVDHLMNNAGDQLDQSTYLHNFIYPTPPQSTPFNGNGGTVYFAHQPPPMSNGGGSSSSSSLSQSTQGHFPQYHPTRTFENSNRHQFHHLSHFQSSSGFQPTPPSTQLSTPTSSFSHIHQQSEEPSVDLPPRFRRLAKSDHSQQRPMSGDFENLHNSSRFNRDNRFQSRPQSFYDFSSHQQSNNNCFRLSNNTNRYQRNNNNNNNNNNLPLSAYMNTDDSLYQNENNNYWGTSYQRRRANPQRTYHQDKHQFPLSSYDPRQYGFNNNYQKRNDFNNRTNSNRRNLNNNQINHSNDIDLIEEWWEDDNTELIGTNQPTINTDSKITTIDDSGNSSLSTSIHLKESTLDDDNNNNNISTNDLISPPSDISTTDSNIIESLDQLQQQLKLEEDVEKQLESENDNLENELLSLNKEMTTYDTAHFMQWAKEKFREELAGRLTAQEIKQHDAVVTDDDDDDEDLLIDAEKYTIDQTTDDDNIDELEKLKIEETIQQTIVVE